MKQTTKSLATTLGALLVAAAIGGVALWVTRDTEKKAAQKERALNERLDLIQGRLLELVDGVREMASHPDNFRSSSSAAEGDEERDLHESLREVAQSSHEAGPYDADD